MGGRAPIIRDGNTVLAESGAIVEYIVQRHANGRLAVPVSSPDYARYTYWMHFAEGSFTGLSGDQHHAALAGFRPAPAASG
jgi:glutathione S-transferase